MISYYIILYVIMLL